MLWLLHLIFFLLLRKRLLLTLLYCLIALKLLLIRFILSSQDASLYWVVWMLVVLFIGLILHLVFRKFAISRLIIRLIDYLIRAHLIAAGLGIVLILTFLCLINHKLSYFTAATLSHGGFLFVIYFEFSVTYSKC